MPEIHSKCVAGCVYNSWLIEICDILLIFSVNSLLLIILIYAETMRR